VHKAELLSRAHDRESFDCGNAQLNSYLRQVARQHTDRGISRTYILIEGARPEPKPILGYFSITICQVLAAELHSDPARKLPREISGVKLGRLAVAAKLQGQRIGSRLLMDALKKSLEVFDLAGGVGVFVDAKDAHARQFYERFGFIPLASDNLKLFLPIADIRALVGP
jgi:GNAT superfamily N-acetyltransferase